MIRLNVQKNKLKIFFAKINFIMINWCEILFIRYYHLILNKFIELNILYIYVAINDRFWKSR